MAEVVPKAALAAEVRSTAADHDHWDRPACFRILHWHEDELWTSFCAFITLEISTEEYPALVRDLVTKNLLKGDRSKPPPCAYLLEHEGWMAQASVTASKAERDQIDRDAAARRIHTRPDRVETAIVIAADVHGRLFSAFKRRDTGEVTENMTMPGQYGRDGVGGRLPEVLLAAANAIGVAFYDLPGPPAMAN